MNPENVHQVNTLSSKMNMLNLNSNGSNVENYKSYDINDTDNKIYVDEITDTLDELLESFITINTYNEYDEYKLLVNNANCSFFEYNKDETIYRYKRYIKFIKLSPELFNMINNFLKIPKFELMKEIDNHILTLIE